MTKNSRKTEQTPATATETQVCADMQKHRGKANPAPAATATLSDDKELCIAITQEEVDNVNKYYCKQVARWGKPIKPGANMPWTLKNLKINSRNDLALPKQEKSVIEDCQVQTDKTSYSD